MNKGVVICAALFYFLVLVIGTGSALRCYSCSGGVGFSHDCERRPNRVPAAYCQYGYNTCMTLIMHNTITRACAQSNVCHLYQNTPGFQACSTCVTELCNNAVKMSSFALPLVIFIVLVLLKTAVY
ncbi:hypothetical protein NQ315_000439 [Exocentrus adspersus]|uniref:Protein sleepless n=1 Tax=Exocentrus adspersus TaxID=1586481 RepID=A0AAV8VMR3_9CUCU|nr:hypothetical protein NQ315_000439 [Exocentrus adspersus]